MNGQYAPAHEIDKMTDPAGHVASGGGPAGPPQQRSSLKLSRAASSNLSTSDEPQPLLSRSAESLHGASAAVRRAKQEVRGQRPTATGANVCEQNERSRRRVLDQESRKNMPLGE